MGACNLKIHELEAAETFVILNFKEVLNSKGIIKSCVSSKLHTHTKKERERERDNI